MCKKHWLIQYISLLKIKIHLKILKCLACPLVASFVITTNDREILRLLGSGVKYNPVVRAKTLYSSLDPTWRKDNFLLLRVEGREGVLLFHQELGGESIPQLKETGTCGIENINSLKCSTRALFIKLAIQI